MCQKQPKFKFFWESMPPDPSVCERAFVHYYHPATTTLLPLPPPSPPQLKILYETLEWGIIT